MKVIILAGGLGTRLQEETVVKPKPMVEIGEQPVLWHIMNIYAAYGYNEFIIALGYKGEWIKKYFLNYHCLSCDITVKTASGETKIHDYGMQKDWIVHLVDTGYHTNTGGRLKRLAHFVENETFMLTYGDAVANINIKKLIDFHRQHGKIGTVAAVRPPSRFGGLTLKDNLVEEFIEKPQIGEGFISGGFFVLEPKVLQYIASDQNSLERELLPRLVKEKQLCAYRHEGFWQCMDVLREVQLLNSLWESGSAPWKI